MALVFVFALFQRAKVLKKSHIRKYIGRFLSNGRLFSTKRLVNINFCIFYLHIYIFFRTFAG